MINFKFQSGSLGRLKPFLAKVLCIIIVIINAVDFITSVLTLFYCHNFVTVSQFILARLSLNSPKGNWRKASASLDCRGGV